MCWPRLVHDDDDEEDDIANGEYSNTPFITAPAMVQILPRVHPVRSNVM